MMGGGNCEEQTIVFQRWWKAQGRTAAEAKTTIWRVRLRIVARTTFTLTAQAQYTLATTREEHCSTLMLFG